MESVVWLLAAGLAVTAGVPIWLYLSFRRHGGALMVREEMENRGILAEEWDFVYRRHCLPTHCSRLRGDPPACPRNLECEICAAYVMERHWQRLTAVHPTRRIWRRAAAWVWVGTLLAGMSVALLCTYRAAHGACALAAGSAALLLAGSVVRARRTPRARAGSGRGQQPTHLSPPFAAG